MTNLHRSLRGAAALMLSCAMAFGTVPAAALAEAVEPDGEGLEQVEVADAETVTSLDDGDDAAVGDGPLNDEPFTAADDADASDDVAGEASAEDLMVQEDALGEDALSSEEDSSDEEGEAAISDDASGDVAMVVQSANPTDLDEYYFLFDGDVAVYKDYHVKQGGSVKPSITVFYYPDDGEGDSEGRKFLNPSKYTLTFYKWNVNAAEWKKTTLPLYEGGYKVIATPTSGSGLTGSMEVTFDVYGPRNLNGATIEFPGALEDFSYRVAAGTTLTPVVKIDGATVPESGYTIEYESWNTEKRTSSFPTKPGRYWVYATGVSPYTGSVLETIYIYAPISRASVSAIATKTYTGKAIKPKPTVKLDGTTLELNNDYSLSYKNNVNAGTASVVIKGNGDVCTGSKTVTFKIAKAANPLKAKATKSKVSCLYKPKAAMPCGKNVTVTGAKGKVTYANASTNATAKKFTVNKKTGKVTLKKGTKKGTYTVKIKVKAAGNKNYKAGSKTVSYKIVVGKGDNPMTVKAVTRTVSYADVSAGNAVVDRPMTVSKAKGALSYAKAGGSGNLAVNKKDGRVMVKRGTARGTYEIKIKVTAAGDANYKAGTKTVTCTIKVV